jgi:hypothetical protein
MTTLDPCQQSAPTSTPDQQLARDAVVALVDDLKRWAGKAPAAWTRQRAENVRAVSSWKRARAAGELPTVYDTMLGPRFAEMVQSGRCFAYPLLQRQGVRVELPAGAKWKLTDRHVRALGLVVAGHLSCKTKGLIISHATMGELLACSTRTAGTVMRQLAIWNLLEVQPWFEPAGATNLRQSSLYRVSAFAVALFDITPRRSRSGSAAKSSAALAVVLPEDKSPAGDTTPSCSAPGESAPGSAVVRAWQDLPSRTIAPKGAEQEGVVSPAGDLSSGRTTARAADDFARGSSVDPAAPVESSRGGGRGLPAKLAAYADAKIAAAERRVMHQLGMAARMAGAARGAARARANPVEREQQPIAAIRQLAEDDANAAADVAATAEQLADRQRFAQKRAEDRAAQRAKCEADDFDAVLARAVQSWEQTPGAMTPQRAAEPKPLGLERFRERRAVVREAHELEELRRELDAPHLTWEDVDAMPPVEPVDN